MYENLNKEKKSIAFYVGDYTLTGGTERACISVANGLAATGKVSVFLFVTNADISVPSFAINENVNIIYLNIKNCKKEYFLLLNKISKALQINKIDILIGVEIMSLLFLLPLFIFRNKSNLKTSLWVWEHFNYTVSLGKKSRVFFRRMAAKFADVIIVLTERDKLLWQENLTIKGNIVSINNPSPFKVSNKNYNNHTKNIVAVGRLTYQKGFDKLLSIWNKFEKNNLNPNSFKLQIIGEGEDRSSLQGLIKKNNLTRSVELLGNKSNIQDYYENSSFLVMTSRFEGLPMTLIEAQSFKLPIISYDCLTGPSEVISAKSGYLVEYDDEDNFINKLSELTVNKELREEMSGHAAIEVSRFNIENIVNNWLKIIS